MFGWVKKIFKRSADKPQELNVIPDPLTAGEIALKNWGVEYRKMKNGTLFVPGSLNMSNKGLKELPDLSSVVIEENFSCINNHLTSLKGAPRMFKALISDFGTFWEGNVPDNLRRPPPQKFNATGSFEF